MEWSFSRSFLWRASGRSSGGSFETWCRTRETRTQIKFFVPSEINFDNCSIEETVVFVGGFFCDWSAWRPFVCGKRGWSFHNAVCIRIETTFFVLKEPWLPCCAKFSHTNVIIQNFGLLHLSSSPLSGVFRVCECSELSEWVVSQKLMVKCVLWPDFLEENKLEPRMGSSFNHADLLLARPLQAACSRSQLRASLPVGWPTLRCVSTSSVVFEAMFQFLRAQPNCQRDSFPTEQLLSWCKDNSFTLTLIRQFVEPDTWDLGTVAEFTVNWSQVTVSHPRILDTSLSTTRVGKAKDSQTDKAQLEYLHLWEEQCRFWKADLMTWTYLKTKIFSLFCSNELRIMLGRQPL